jgi:hypothetical protein
MVWIRGGVYLLARSFALTAEDAGSESAPVLWHAYPDEEVPAGVLVRVRR